VDSAKHGLFPKLPSISDNKYYGIRNGAVTEVAAAVTLAADREVNAAEPPASSDSRLRTPFNINYIKNPDAEIDASGWATYADAAGTQPVDGTGGIPGSTWTRLALTTLRGSALFQFSKTNANVQGEGVSYNFTIDTADANKAMSVSFSVANIDNALKGGWLSVWVYDVTNARLCPISGSNTITGNGQFTLQFSTSTSTSYRLCIHVSGTDGTGGGIYFDDFYVGPTYLPSAPAMSDWQDGGAITITSTGTSPTKGTTARDKVWWRRVGDSMEIRYEFRQTTVGTLGTGSYRLAIPGGYAIDTAKLYSLNDDTLRGGCVGGGVITNILSANLLGCTVHVQSPTTLSVCGESGGNQFVWGVVGFGLNNPELVANFYATVPITGWSGSTAVQPGSRYLWAQRFAANAVRVTAAPSKPGEYRARRLGTDTAPTTAPSAADAFKIGAGSGIGSGIINWYDIYIGPGKIVQLAPYLNTGRAGGLVTDFYYTPGSAVRGTVLSYDPSTGIATVIASTGGASDAVGNSADLSTQPTTAYFDILVADDPVPVALAPAVHVEASSNAGQSITTNVTDFIFEDKAVDTHGAYNVSNGRFTAPVAGVYAVLLHYRLVGAGCLPNLYKNGAFYRGGGCATTPNYPGNGAWSVKLAAGDYITIREEVAASTVVTNTGTNAFSITRIGDA